MVVGADPESVPMMRNEVVAFGTGGEDERGRSSCSQL